MTAIVDLTRDEHGNLHARLHDVVGGHSSTVDASWLTEHSRRHSLPGGRQDGMRSLVVGAILFTRRVERYLGADRPGLNGPRPG